MNKSYKTDPPKFGSLYQMSTFLTSVGGATYRKSVLVSFSKTVSPTNKSYKIGTPKVGVALQGGHIILRGCVKMIEKLQKKTKIAQNQLLWVKLHVLC